MLANIVADVIIPLSARAGEFLDTDGVFLCSGIIDTRAGEVEAALERNGLAVFERREQNGWVALAAVRPGSGVQEGGARQPGAHPLLCQKV